MKFKVYINAVRANANMSIKEFAAKLGVSTVTVSHWENGTGRPSLEQVRKMSEISGIPMDYIFLRDDATISH